jgi:membrane fusion protein, multidrug efflux system
VKTTVQSILTRTAAITAVLLLALLAGCGSEKTEPGQGETGSATITVPVDVAPVAAGTLSVSRTYSATLEGQEQANIVPRLSERVAKVHVQVGATVAADRLIITLDKSGASSQYYQAEANYRNAEKSLERMKSLYAEGAVSLQTLDGVQTQYDVARANYVAARSIVELTTPIGGVVTAVNVNIGDLASPGVPLATVARIDRMKAIFNLNESDVASLAIGQKVAITSEARPDLSVQGNIVQISRSADVRSRSFEVKAMFPNTTDRWFRPGMFAKIRIQIASSASALSVPNVAIQTDGITSKVFVVRNGRALQRTVEAGMTDGERTVILKGLSPTDTVATVGINNVRDSSHVVVSQHAGAR